MLVKGGRGRKGRQGMRLEWERDCLVRASGNEAVHKEMKGNSGKE